MPGFATHYLFGVSTIQKQKQTPLFAHIKHHPTVYGLGLQGPDVFFYYVPDFLRPMNNPGAAAHRERTGHFLHYLLESRKLFTKPSDLEIATVYIQGFLGHYTLDTTCHPYIYGRTHYSPEDGSYYGRHVYLETDIDAFLLAQYKKMLPSDFYQARTIRLTDKECHVVAAILHYVYDLVFPDLHISYHHMRSAIRFMEFAVGALHDPTGKKKALVRLIEGKFPGYAYASPLIASDSLRFTRDPMNFSHRLWRNPWQKSDASRETFFDLLKKARMTYQKRLSLCERLFAYDTLPEDRADQATYDMLLAELENDLGNRSYSSGLEL